jgi:two-component SAPR family response regulator
MATISIWDNNQDETTLEYLNESIKAMDSNAGAIAFIGDLQKIVGEPMDQTSTNYFADKLKNQEIMHTYQRILFAKAAEKIALSDFHNNDSQIIYLEKATQLNPWNQQYYMELSKAYLTAGKNNNVKETLQRCVSQLKSDSTDCAKMQDSSI